MTRFTKATLIVAALVLAATACMVGKVYIVRCGFNIGKEWQISAVGAVARSENCDKKLAEHISITMFVSCCKSKTKAHKVAHREFLRLNKLMKAIGKNDALYGPVINRYCMIYSECLDFEDKQKMLYETADALEKKFAELGDMGFDEIIAFSKQLTALHKAIVGYDSAIMQKRKMMFDIEKENCMTVSAALRTIPKEPSKAAENPLIALLSGGEDEEET